MTNFTATLQVGEGVYKIRSGSIGWLSTYTEVPVSAEKRAKKLKALLAVLKKQKVKASVEYTADKDGNQIAIVTAENKGNQ